MGAGCVSVVAAEHGLDMKGGWGASSPSSSVDRGNVPCGVVFAVGGGRSCRCVPPNPFIRTSFKLFKLHRATPNSEFK